jgi:cytochrome b561
MSGIRERAKAMTTERYSRLAVLLHWVIAAVTIPMLFFGEELVEIEEGGGTFLPSVHASVGMAILFLTFLRIALRLGLAPPPLPASMPGWQRKLSGLTHGLFYLLLIGLPLTGLMASKGMTEAPLAIDMSIFGVLTAADLPLPALPGASQVHEIGGKIGIALLILHVAAALYHQFWVKDGLLRRMT